MYVVEERRRIIIDHLQGKVGHEYAFMHKSFHYINREKHKNKSERDRCIYILKKE
jgi:hypothetical protein